MTGGTDVRVGPSELVSVVLAVRNGADVVARQLATLARQDYAGPWELVVVDNGSTDRTVQVVSEWLDKLPIRVLDGSAVQGCGPARGLGVADAQGGRVVFCDADDEVDSRWLSAMAEALGNADFVAGWFSLFRGEEPSQPQQWLHPGVYCRFLPYANGCSMGVWRDRLLQVGGFDPRMVQSDDVDLSWRLQLAGYRLKDAHGARVHKRERETSRGRWVQTYRWGRFDPILFTRYRSHGMPRSSITKALLSYGWLVLALPILPFSPARRDRWIDQSSRRAGRIVGSLCERVLFL